MDEVKCEVWRLVKDADEKDVVLLRDGSGRTLPIWIDPCQAASIFVHLEGDRSRGIVRRPMTHDLFVSILQQLGAKLQRVVIDDLWKETYFAKLYLSVRSKVISVDARPSDAIALAIRTGSELYISEPVLAGAPRLIEGNQEEEPEQPE